MPEGDSIPNAARRVGAALIGRTIVSLEDPASLPRRCCATPVRSRGQGADNRTSFWCPSCQD